MRELSIFPIDPGPESVRYIAMDLVGRKVAFQLGDGRVQVWSLASQRVIREWPLGDEMAMCLAFAPDGRYLFAATDHLEGWLWAMDEPAEQLIIDLPGLPRSVAIHPTTNGLLVGTSSKGDFLLTNMLAVLKQNELVAPLTNVQREAFGLSG